LARPRFHPLRLLEMPYSTATFVDRTAKLSRHPARSDPAPDHLTNRLCMSGEMVMPGENSQSPIPPKPGVDRQLSARMRGSAWGSPAVEKRPKPEAGSGSCPEVSFEEVLKIRTTVGDVSVENLRVLSWRLSMKMLTQQGHKGLLRICSYRFTTRACSSNPSAFRSPIASTGSPKVIMVLTPCLPNKFSR